MSEYRAVLLDLDGTLLDTSEGIISSVKYTIDAMGFEPLDNRLYEQFIGPPIQNSFQRIYHLDDSTRDQAASVFREHYSTVDLCKAKLYHGVLETLSELKIKGFKCAVATYKRFDYAKTLLDAFEISRYCDSIQGSDFEGKLTKADIIELCIKELRETKSAILMVGDSENDALGAKNAGVSFLPVTYGFGFHELPNSVDSIKSFPELLRYMNSESESE